MEQTTTKLQDQRLTYQDEQILSLRIKRVELIKDLRNREWTSRKKIRIYLLKQLLMVNAQLRSLGVQVKDPIIPMDDVFAIYEG